MACIVGHAPRIPFLFDPKEPLTFRGIFYYCKIFFLVLYLYHYRHCAILLDTRLLRIQLIVSSLSKLSFSTIFLFIYFL